MLEMLLEFPNTNILSSVPVSSFFVKKNGLIISQCYDYICDGNFVFTDGHQKLKYESH